MVRVIVPAGVDAEPGDSRRDERRMSIPARPAGCASREPRREAPNWSVRLVDPNSVVSPECVADGVCSDDSGLFDGALAVSVGREGVEGDAAAGVA